MKEINIAPHPDMARGFFNLGQEVEDNSVESNFFGKIGDLTDSLFAITLMNEMDSVVFIVNPEDVPFFKAWLEESLSSEVED